MKHLGKYLLTLVIVIIAISLVGCTSKTTTTTLTTTTTNTLTASVSLSNFSFQPSSLTVKAGTTVTWANKDSTTHTVTSDSGVFNSGNLAPNATFSYTFNTAGTFTYYCSIHPTMKGTVKVE